MNQWTERLVLGAVALVVGLGLGWAGRGLATYNSNTESVSTYGDWRTGCPPASMKDAKCQVIQEVLDSRNGSPVVRIAVGTSKDNKPLLDLTLPLGVALEPGAGLILGSDPVRVFKYRTCGQGGCIAETTLDDKAMASFASSKDGKVLVAGIDGKPVAIPISLKGYSDAYSAGRSADKRRASWFWRLFS
jgi:invasion protein IalB